MESPDLQGSVFIPPTKLNGFLDGDVVRVYLNSAGEKVVALRLERRERTQVIGEVRKDGKLQVDPGLGSLVVPLSGSAPEGACVLAELGKDGAQLIEVVDADPCSEEALRRRIMSRHGLPWCHGEESLAAAGRVASTAPARNLRQHDLTGQVVVTIDADHSVDLDDALSAAPARNGSLRVWVHVADVASRVLPGDPLDTAALATPTSVYLPGFTRHMLPEAMSAGSLSLLPGVDRDVLTVEMLLDSEGQVRSVDVYESRIHSARRLNYEQVGTLLVHGSCDGVSPEHAALVSLLSAAADRLGVARAARGGLDSSWFDPEPAGASGSDDAHLLVERLMVAANEAVAGWLDERGMPALYRIHPGLDDAQAGELEELAAGLGMFAELPRPVTPRSVAALARGARRTVHAEAFKDAMMRLAGRASYAAAPDMHFGLASPRYLHFTSPLRRYADLMVHRSVKAFLSGDRELDWSDLGETASHVTDVSGRADAAERDMKRALLARSLRPRTAVDVVVTSVSARGARVLVRGVTELIPGVSNARPGSVIRARVRVSDPLTGRLVLACYDTARSGRTAVPAGSAAKRNASAIEKALAGPAALSGDGPGQSDARHAGAGSGPEASAMPAAPGSSPQASDGGKRSARSRSRGAGKRPARPAKPAAAVGDRQAA